MILRTASKLVRGVVEIVIIIIAALIISAVVRAFVVETYEVPTGSMEPTIEVGDRILSQRIAYYKGTPQPGDIVTFSDPIEPDRTLVKRTIAVAGDTVDISDGNLYINGELQDEPYTHGQPTEPLASYDLSLTISYPYTIPDGYIWVMGDNRTNSADSRYFGPVKESVVSGKVFLRYWPFDRFGKVE
ncbi:MAG: signal peptidase I [Coriobacteriales bacterium]|jgi:signal peptidase I